AGRSGAFSAQLTGEHPLPVDTNVNEELARWFLNVTPRSANAHLFPQEGLIFQNKSHLHVHAIGGDFIALDHDLLLLNPSALDIFEGLDGARDALLDGVLEAACR